MHVIQKTILLASIVTATACGADDSSSIEVEGTVGESSLAGVFTHGAAWVDSEGALKIYLAEAPLTTSFCPDIGYDGDAGMIALRFKAADSIASGTYSVVDWPGFDEVGVAGDLELNGEWLIFDTGTAELERNANSVEATFSLEGHFANSEMTSRIEGNFSLDLLCQ